MFASRFHDRVRLTDEWLEVAAANGMGIDAAATLMDERLRDIARREQCDYGEAHARALARLITEHTAS